MTASRENRDVESTTAGTLVTTGPKRLANGPCWNLNLRFPACTRAQRTNAVSSSLVLFQVRRACLSFHLRRTCLSLQFIVCLFCLSTVVRAVVSCYSWPLDWLKIVLSLQKDCFIAMSPMMSHAHSSSSSCLHMRVPPSSLSIRYPRHQPLRSRCRSINTALIHRMRSMALWPKQHLLQVMSPTWSTTPATQRLVQAIFQSESVDIDTEPSCSFDAELDDELLTKALSSQLFTQEREEPANLRQTYHSHEESLSPAQSFFTRASTGKPVYEPSSNLSQERKSSRDLENKQIRILLERQKKANSCGSQIWDPEARTSSRVWQKKYPGINWNCWFSANGKLIILLQDVNNPGEINYYFKKNYQKQNRDLRETCIRC